MAGRDFVHEWFPPTPPRVAVEQLRIVLASAQFSFIVSAVGNTIVACIYMTIAPVWPLVIWAAISWMLVPVARYLAQRFFSLADPPAEVGAYMRTTIVLFTSIGVLRGLLPWLALDHASPFAVAMLVCYMIALLAASMAYLAPVFPAFIGYTTTFMILMVPKLYVLGNVLYGVAVIMAILFSLVVVSSALRSSKTFRNAIELRFQNVELVEKLRLETATAEAALREAESANQAKSKFLAAASHDLRQPIHAQGLFLEVLARANLSPSEREVLASARAACRASGEMLNTLLDFSRLEAGVVAVDKRSFRLQPLLNKIAVELAPLADQKDIVYRMRETAAVVHSDPVLLELILRNLISNAIRYTDRGGVLIGCRRRGPKLSIEVCDTGIGIAPDNQSAIFREFHQLGNPERDRRKGLGLGLAITERLARALGEDLSLRSHVGRGSRFAIAVPYSADQSIAQSTQDSTPRIGTLDVQVLVVEDDEAIRAGMQSLLQSWGARCEAVETIEEALAKAEEHKPDVAICDYRLRDQRTGLEAIAALRRIYPGLPAILITGDTAPERLREGQASGIPLLHKPVMPDELYHKIVDGGWGT